MSAERSIAQRNVCIPEKYKAEILAALARFPELKDVSIHFRLVVHASAVYSAKPDLVSCFRSAGKRRYVVMLLEHAPYPVCAALMKHLTPEMRVSVLAHELSHIVQYEKCRSAASLLAMLGLYALPFCRRRIERNADKCAIERGLGEGLLAHANYIRSIPGYIKEQPSLDRYYLKPGEIRNYRNYLNSLGNQLKYI